VLPLCARGEWRCPPCLGLCNCSGRACSRYQGGLEPTEQLKAEADAQGFKSVRRPARKTLSVPTPERYQGGLKPTEQLKAEADAQGFKSLRCPACNPLSPKTIELVHPSFCMMAMHRRNGSGSSNIAWPTHVHSQMPLRYSHCSAASTTRGKPYLALTCRARSTLNAQPG
jgi:hypothetical protein